MWFVSLKVTRSKSSTTNVLNERLSGIDCPEKRQPFGEQARHATSALVFGKDVTVQTHGKDKNCYALADVLLSDSANVNKMLVAGGWCWWYPKFARQKQRAEAARI